MTSVHSRNQPRSLIELNFETFSDYIFSKPGDKSNTLSLSHSFFSIVMETFYGLVLFLYFYFHIFICDLGFYCWDIWSSQCRSNLIHTVHTLLNLFVFIDTI